MSRIMKRWTELTFEEKVEEKMAWLRYYLKFHRDDPITVNWARGKLMKSADRNEVAPLTSYTIETFDDLKRACADLGFPYLHEDNVLFWRYEQEEEDIRNQQDIERLEASLSFTKRKYDEGDLERAYDRMWFNLPTATDEELNYFLDHCPNTVDEYNELTRSMGFGYIHDDDSASHIHCWRRYRSEKDRETQPIRPRRRRVPEDDRRRLDKFERAAELDLASQEFFWFFRSLIPTASRAEVERLIGLIDEDDRPATQEETASFFAENGFHFTPDNRFFYHSGMEWVAKWVHAQLYQRNSLRLGMGRFRNWPYEQRLAFSEIPRNRGYVGAYSQPDSEYVLDLLRQKFNNQMLLVAEENGIVRALEHGLSPEDVLGAYVSEY